MNNFAPPLLRAKVKHSDCAFAYNRWASFWYLALDAGWRLIRAGRVQFGSAFLFLAISVAAQSENSREYELKAAFMHNFARFAEWPESAFATSNSPIVIALLGDDPFGRVLDETVRRETIGGRRLLVERHRRAEEVKTCHILFVSQSEIRQMDEIVKSLKGKAVLTVTDAPRPAFAGVIIRFTTEKHELCFHINHPAARAAGLTISSRLLRLADTTAAVKKP